MAVMAGNSGETCYSKYGSVSIKAKYCHEMVRAQSIHTNKHTLHTLAHSQKCENDTLQYMHSHVCISV